MKIYVLSMHVFYRTFKFNFGAQTSDFFLYFWLDSEQQLSLNFR